MILKFYGEKMYLQKLYLRNFRNYEELNLEFNEKLNIFIGGNGHGKTNVLESIFFSFILKSHRTNKSSDLIKFGEEGFSVNLICKKDNLREITTDVKLYKDNKKSILVNGIKVQKISDFIGLIKVVMFSPEDLRVIKGAPNIRRKFLDMNISQIDKVYLKSIINYNKVLDMKNNLLKTNKIDDKLLDVYDEQIAFFTNFIINRRFKYLNILKGFSEEVHNNISGFNERLNIKYINFMNKDFEKLNENIDIKKEIFDILKKNREIDKIKKFSTIGVHKDDFIIFMNGNQVSNYSSQGQQRSAIISIKLGIVELIKKITNEYPILLLDDILSELDKGRRNFILNFVKNAQTFITGTDLYENIIDSHKIFNVYDGRIL